MDPVDVKCPNCGSTSIYTFKRCTLLDGAGKHYACKDCRLCFSDEYLLQLALGLEFND